MHSDVCPACMYVIVNNGLEYVVYLGKFCFCTIAFMVHD